MRKPTSSHSPYDCSERAACQTTGTVTSNSGIERFSAGTVRLHLQRAGRLATARAAVTAAAFLPEMSR